MNDLHADLKPHRNFVRPVLPGGDLWVFGYGSLMWNPGFDYQQHRPARLYGYHRALCIWSHVHRGTEDQPGMVLGLDRGGSCLGHAFRVAAEDKARVAEYLYAREMPTAIYRARLLPVHFTDADQRALALSFVVDQHHHQYAGKVDPQHCAQAIHRAHGISGSSRDYLDNTLAHLHALGIKDLRLQRVARLLNQQSPDPAASDPVRE